MYSLTVSVQIKSIIYIRLSYNSFSNQIKSNKQITYLKEQTNSGRASDIIF